MKNIFKDFLFSKNILVNDSSREQEIIYKAYTLYCLAKFFAVKITSGQEYLDPKMLRLAQEGFGIDYLEDYYRGFSEFNDELMSDKLFFKEIESYFESCKEKKSDLLYEIITRKLPFNKDYKTRNFSVVTKAQAEEILGGYVVLLQASSGDLNSNEEEFLKAYREAYGERLYDLAEMDNDIKKMVFAIFKAENETIPTGSLIHIEKGKKIRFFTCWKKKDYIDFELIGFDSDGKGTGFSSRVGEFSKRNDEMPFTVFGEENCRYIDIDFDKFKEQKPEISYLLIRDEGKFTLRMLEEEKYYIAEKIPYFCKVGFVLKNIDAKEEVFEPETVDTPYAIEYENAKLYFCVIDLKRNNLIWLNLDEIESFEDIEKKYFIS